MDIIEMARELGKAIQQDSRFAEYQVAEAICDNDLTLQEDIKRFNFIKISLNQAVQAEDKDDDKVAMLNREMRELYDHIMAEPKMVTYNTAKQEISALLSHINTIIERSASGDDPSTVDISSCGGGCSSCSGCH